jgi:hypothetical protein
MSENKRLSNEKEFDEWIEKQNGGRIYSFQISGKHGWVSKYLKETNADEITIKFWQEIYDEQGNLKEIHEKYPVDKGHKKLK